MINRKRLCMLLNRVVTKIVSLEIKSTHYNKNVLTFNVILIEQHIKTGDDR